MLQITNVSADKNPYYSMVDSGNATLDNVFLLSAPEAEKYFTSDEARKADIYSSVSNEYHSDSWWVRTPGACRDTISTYYRYVAVRIGNTGAVSYGGAPADNINGVRPAMWISISG